VKDDVKFTVEGQPATVFDLRPGMNVRAEKIVEAPDVEIVRDRTVIGHAPAAVPSAAATPGTKPRALPASGGAPAASAPSGASPAGVPAAEAGAAAPAGAAGGETPVPVPEPAAGRGPLVWVGLVLAVVIIGLVVFNRSRGTK
jgi:hypothetical protein